MKATTEIEVQVSGATITSAEVRNDVLKLVEASKLSLDDEFMQYKFDKNTFEARFKEILTKVIQSGLSDFWRPNMDPSFDETRESICYVAGKIPATGKPEYWWKNVVTRKVGLQLGSVKQYVAFIGCLIKKLVEEGWPVSQAWYAVCIDSKSLGNYMNLRKTSDGVKPELEMTGSREVCGFYDLSNTYKILVDNEDMCLASGCYCDCSYDYPLAFSRYSNDNLSDNFYSVGWLVLNCSADH